MIMLIKFREKEHITQKELAELIGVKRSAISKYENGLMMPSVPVLKKLADVLGCTVDDLVKDSTIEK